MAEKRSRSTWRVHESTARGLCRLAFVVLGIVPLGLCALYSAQQFLPGYQTKQIRVFEQLLSAHLGLGIKITAVESRTPQEFALHEIRLFHPETHEALGEVRLVEVRRAEGKWDIRLTNPKLDGDRLAPTFRLIHDWLLCRPRSNSQAANIDMEQLSIYDARTEINLYKLAFSLLPTEEATFLTMRFSTQPVLESASKPTNGSTAESPPAPLTQLIVKRHHRQLELRTELQLRTGGTALPCTLFSKLIPELALLGDQARFAGTLNIDVRGQAWSMAATNSTIAGIDMGRLTGGSEAAISGVGQVWLNPLLINNQGIQQAYGNGEIVNGSMVHGLFSAMGQNLGVQLRVTNPVTSYSFDRFHFSVHLSEPKLHFVCQMLDALGVLAERQPGNLNRNWNQGLPLENLVATLDHCAAPTRLANATQGGLPVSWLSKQALVWLPMGSQFTQTQDGGLRLSANQSPNANE